MKIAKNRWFMAASAVGTHISIGSIYAYSAWKMPLENTFGWSATKTSMAFSIAIFCLGLSAAFLGRFIERKGPRVGCLLATAFFCTGLLGASFACHIENLILFYVFFGGVSGVGLGLGYISPVSTLVKWFPDRRGLATGLAIMGFGFGGLVCTKFIDILAPATQEVVLHQSIDAVDYQSAEAALMNTPSLQSFKESSKELYQIEKEGGNDTPYYDDLKAKVGSFRTVLIYEKASIVKAFLILAAVYFLIMFPSALYIAPPSVEDLALFAKKQSNGIIGSTVLGEMNVKEALKTPGFYGLWLMLFLNATCGIALIATAKKMGYEMVRLPAELASVMVMGISLFNGLGRIFWSTLSDVIGRSNTFLAFFLIQVVAFPLLAQLSAYPWAFMAVTFIILSCYGGGFSTMPAYITDLFGMKDMPVILGLILTAWSTAGIVGPMLNSYVYQQTHSYQQSLYLFAGAILIGLILSLLMKLEIKRLQVFYRR